MVHFDQKNRGVQLYTRSRGALLSEMQQMCMILVAM